MANFYIDPPDELEDDMNVNISNIHSFLTRLATALNFGMGNIDTDNFTEEIADKINDLMEGDE